MRDADTPLPAAAQAAWQAYREMIATKDAHFEFLAELSRLADSGEPRSLARSARLATLLDAHTRAVQSFRASMADLAARDPAARDALLAHLTRDNATLGADPPAPH